MTLLGPYSKLYISSKVEKGSKFGFYIFSYKYDQTLIDSMKTPNSDPNINRLKIPITMT